MKEAEGKKLTIHCIGKKKREGEKIAMLTAYDYQTASLLDRAGVDILLVGDSLGMVVLGYDNTLPVTVQEVLHHVKAVNRGRKRALLVADMPFLSFHTGIADAIRNAGLLVKEGGAEAVKIEGGRKRRDIVKALVDAEIPVMGHIGLTPQSINVMGGYRVQGKTVEVGLSLLKDAETLQEAGAFALVLEGVPYEVAGLITEKLRIPTIGIGAGENCDGQVLVINDMVGLTPPPLPKFVRKYACLRAEMERAVSDFISDVKNLKFPGDNESYRMDRELAALLVENAERSR